MKNVRQQTIAYGLEDITQTAEQLVTYLPICRVMTFTGSLGAGKTTLIRELLRKIGIQEPITSPTFTYMNLYVNQQGEKFYHFDLYRIASLDDFCLSGFDEYLYQPNSWALIEWPEIIMPLLTHDACSIFLEYFEEKRIMHVKTW